MAKRMLLWLVVVAALLPMLACIEIALDFQIDAGGTGIVTAEIGGEPAAMSAREKEAIAEFTEKGWTAVRQETRAEKRVLVFSRSFSGCAEIKDMPLSLRCLTAPRNLLQRSFVFDADVVPPGGASVRISATLPGALLATNGTSERGGKVQWNGAQRRLTAVSAIWALPQASGIAPEDLPLVVGLVGALAVSLVAALAGVWVMRRRSGGRSMACPRCSKARPASGRFCRHCGQALAPAELEHPSRFSSPVPMFGLALLGGGIAWALVSIATGPAAPEQCAQGFVDAVAKGHVAQARATYLTGDALSLGDADLVGRIPPASPNDTVEVKIEGSTEGPTAKTRVTTAAGSRTDISFALVPDQAGHWRISHLGGAETVGKADADEGSRMCRPRTLATAEHAFRRAISANPEDATFVAELGVCYLKLGDLAQAEHQLRKAVAMRPTSVPHAWSALAEVLRRREDPKQLEQTVREGLAHIPHDPALSNHLAALLISQDRALDEALGLARSATTAQPDNAAFLDTLGWALLRKGDRAEAQRVLQKAAQLAPNDTAIRAHYESASLTTTVWCLRAQAHAQAGRYSDAVQAYDDALAIEPQDAGIRSKRTAVLRLAVDDHVQRAQALLSQAQYDAALVECGKALKLDAENGAAAELTRRIEETKRVLGYR